MTTYIVHRLVLAILVILIVTILVFLAIHLLPGDPILFMMSAGARASYSPEQLNLLRHQYGLDRPLVVQYISWIFEMFRGNLGMSIQQGVPTIQLLRQSLPITFYLSSIAFIFGTTIGLLAGVICAIRRGKWIDTVVTMLANLGITVPIFWLGIILMYIVALKFRILPVFGYVSPFDNFWESIRHIILPVFCLAIFPLAAIARETRSSMLEVLRQDYVRTAWSKGLRERMVIMRHCLKNALIPVVMLSGLGLSNIIGGSVLIEQVFNIPGMGRLAYNSVMGQDYPVVQGVTIIVATSVVLVNLLIDISIGWLDPRVRFR